MAAIIPPGPLFAFTVRPRQCISCYDTSSHCPPASEVLPQHAPHRHRDAMPLPAAHSHTLLSLYSDGATPRPRRFTPILALPRVAGPLRAPRSAPLGPFRSLTSPPRCKPTQAAHSHTLQSLFPVWCDASPAPVNVFPDLTSRCAPPEGATIRPPGTIQTAPGRPHRPCDDSRPWLPTATRCWA